MKLITNLFILLLASVNAYATCNGPNDTITSFSLVANSSSQEIKDNRTNLVWRRCPLGMTYDTNKSSCSGTSGGNTYDDSRAAEAPKKWIDALNAVVTFNTNNPGKNWRMANAKELLSIMDPNCEGNIDKSQFFTVHTQTGIWTSTPASNAAGNAYYFNLSLFWLTPTKMVPFSPYIKGKMVLLVRNP